jgi:hypothetical protein
MLKGCKPSRTPEIDTDSTTPHSASKESSSYPSSQTLRRTRTILNFWAFLRAGSGVLFSDAIFKQIFGFKFSRAPALRTQAPLHQRRTLRSVLTNTAHVRFVRQCVFSSHVTHFHSGCGGPSITVKMAVSTPPFRYLVVTIFGIIIT